MSLASLHRLSLLLGSTLERARECAAFLDWLRAEIAPRRAALFVATPGRESLLPAASSGFRKPPRGALPAGHDPWSWLEAQKISLPRGERYALPILLEGELFGLLAVVSAQKGEALSEEQRLLDLALAYLAPILRNIERYENVEQIVAERTTQLRQSEERFRALAETTATAIFVYAGEKFIYVNRATEKLTGYAAEELLTMRFWDVVHPDFQELIRQRGLARQHGEQVPLRYEFKIVRKDGEERWIDFTAGKIEWHGQPAAIGSAFDITERKMAETRLRSVVEQVPLVTYTESSKDGRTIFISPQIQALSGYTPEEWMKDPNLWREVLHPDDRPRIVAENDRTNQNGEPFRVEYRLITRSGEIRWVREEAVLIRDESGVPLYWQGFKLDITASKRAEEALREQEERFRAYIERASDYIFTLDPQGNFTFVNDAMCVALGYHENDLLGKPALTVVAPEARQEAAQALQRMWNGEALDYMELLVQTRDGKTLLVQIRGRTFYREGQLLETLHIARDITQQKQAEEALRESEEKYRTLVEQLPAIVYVDKLDGKGTTLFISPQVETILGISVEEWIKGDTSVWLNTIHPEDRQRVLSAYEGLVESGQSYDLEYRALSREGRWVWFHDVGHILRGSDGELLLHGVMFDITERKQAEEELRTREAQYRSLFEQSHDAIFILDLQGRHLAVNQRAAALLGYSVDELLGLSFRQISAEVSQSENVLSHLLRGEHVPLYERKFRRKNGEIIDVEINVELVRDGRGKPLHIQSVVRDITQRKHHERQLEAQAMLAQALGESLELQPLLERLLEAARHAIPAAEKGSVSLLEADGRLRIRALNGYTDPRLKDFAFASDSGYGVLAARERRPLLIRDARADPEIRYDGEIEEARQINSAIVVPLFIQERVIGVLSLDSTRKDAFTQEDLEHLVGFASSAALVIENARLFEEQTRLANRLQTLHIVSQEVIRRARTPERVYEAVYQAACQLMSADNFTITLHDETRGEFEGVYLIDEGRRYPPVRASVQQGISGLVIRTGKTLRIGDIEKEPAPTPVHYGSEKASRSYLCVPLRIGEKVIGAMSVQSYQPNAYQAEDESLLEMLASSAAAAIENARLFDEIQARLHELEILQTLSASLRQARAVEEMLPLFIQYAARAVNAAAGSIYLWEDASGEWVSQGWMTAEGHWLTDTADLRHAPGEGVTGWVGKRGAIYITTDWRGDSTNQPVPHEMELLQRLTGGISLPLKAEEQIIGVMHLWYAERHDFSHGEIRLLTAIADMAGNAIQRARLHEETIQQVQRLTALRDIDRAIASSFDLNLVFTFLLNGILTQLKADAADILLFDPRTNTLYQAAKRGFRSARLSNVYLRLDESLAGRAALERSLVAIPNLHNTRQGFSKPEFLEGENFRAYYAYPLISKGELKGVLEVFQRTPFFATSAWLDFFETLAGQAAIAIENTRLFENLERSNLELSLAYDETIEGWSRALDLRDKETEGHTRRVTELTIKLAQSMGLSDEEITHIRRGALLHDIGKMGVPDAILLKPGPLSDEEQAIMRMHPQFAYDMLAPIQYLRPALDIPYCHHEKWDGSGYPRGLKGEEIPLAARIFTIADVYDALTSDRPYRPAWLKEKALEYLRQQSGSFFDPQLVEKFIALIERDE